MPIKRISELPAIGIDAAAEVVAAVAAAGNETAAATEAAVTSEIGHAAAAQKALVASTQDEVKTKMEKAMKTAEEFVSFGQGNIEAFVKASQIWAAGVQDLGKQFAATAQAQMDQTVATMKALAGVKSVKEALDLQSSLARASVEKVMAETGKLTDASLKLTEQAMAPITARVTLAMEKFGRTA
jgi:phasin family protein